MVLFNFLVSYQALGGVRAGTDIFKAVALGAQLVFVGRPVIWGLAIGVCLNIHLNHLS